MSLTKIRDKIYAILLGMESFKLSGAVVVFVKSHNIICFSGIIDSLLKIIILSQIFFSRVIVNKEKLL